MGDVRTLQRRRHHALTSHSDYFSLPTSQFATLSSSASSPLPPTDLPVSPIPLNGFRYSFEHIPFHYNGPPLSAKNAFKYDTTGETTNASTSPLASSGDALAAQDQPIQTAHAPV